MEPVERVVYRTQRVEIGAFRCPAGHATFRHAGAIRDHYVFAFPRRAVWIRHQGQPPFAADPGVVTMYNARQPYTREPISPDGDRCEFFAVDHESAFEAAQALDPAVEEEPGRVFRFSHGPSDGATYLAQRELFSSVARAAAADELAVEEKVLELLGCVLSRAHSAWRAGFTPPSPHLDERDHEAVLRARLLLAERFRDAMSLGEVAREAGLSRFRLCRAFRRLTGTTLHALRDQYRLRAALEDLARPGADLTGLALDLGYSSHSHFSARFRRAFDVPPSVVRGRLTRLSRVRPTSAP